MSPSWGGAALYPHRVQRGKEYLESLGFEVIVAEHAMGRLGYLSGTPEERVSDLHRMFGDPEVKAIIATIGGNHSCHLLPLLDFELIRKNPKIFMGFSDITVLNLAIHARTGLVVFNGPTLMTDLAEYPRPLAYTRECLLKALTRPEPVGRVEPAEIWTEELIDWGSEAGRTRARALWPAPGWDWAR
ncbi:MAG: LD-carboxypeptidase [Firmicutes bacterium]|nr:LD-carboxypeptidase [Bacillota bacterium]